MHSRCSGAGTSSFCTTLAADGKLSRLKRLTSGTVEALYSWRVHQAGMHSTNTVSTLRTLRRAI